MREGIWGPTLVLGLALILGLVTPAHADLDQLADELRSRGKLTGLAWMQWAYGVNEPTSQYVDFVVLPELQFRLPYEIDFTTVLRLRGDAFDRLEPGQPDLHTVSSATRRRFGGDRVDFDLRELYFEAKLWSALLTLGKQQIVWGQADGLKVLDIVNPQSFREFILDDFDDSRTPLWAANVEIPVGSWSFQLVWTPDKSYHDFPEEDAVFQITSSQLVPPAPPGVGVSVQDPDRPDRFWQDSDVGLGVGTFLGGWDLTLHYLYVYDDIPIFVTEFELIGGRPFAIVTPSYLRTHVVGGTFSNAFGDLTLRGELAYFTDRGFSTSDPTAPGLVAETGEFSYVLGLDWWGFTETLVSAQLFQSVLIDDDPGVFRHRLTTTLTLLVRRDFLNETLHAEAIWLVSANDGDGLVRGEVAYDINDHWSVWAGFDVFYGDRDGVFGEFDARDRVVLGISVGL